MKKRKGWRAIIYDAPWAYFKKGQSGVIVSEDGKSCETVDDDKSNIKIIAYKNDTYYPKGIGHVLFRQKGSDLFDIVCLRQKASEIPTFLNVDDVYMNGCTATYNGLLEMLNVYWTKGTETTKCTNYNLISPTPQDVFQESTTLDIKVTASIGRDEKEATAKCYISSAGEEVTAYTGTEINIDCIVYHVRKISDGTSTVCVISSSDAPLTCDGGLHTFTASEVGGTASCTITPNNVTLKCSGKRTFIINKSEPSNPIYEIDISCASALNNYKVTQCEKDIRTYSENGVLDWEVVSGNATIIQYNPTLQISVTPGTRSVTLKATERTYGISRTIKITLPS
jgi:hypothetical protein